MSDVRENVTQPSAESSLERRREGHNGHIFGPVHAEGQAQLVLGDINTSNIYNVVNHGPEDADKKKPDIMQVLKYANFTAKKDYSTPGDTYNHDWIWKTSFSQWLVCTKGPRSDKPYWICGKPGSGKSTLTAYLVGSRKTKQFLNSKGGEFKIIHFFYDYRAGKALANTILGMFRMLLFQLADEIKTIRSRLQDLLDQQRLRLESVEDLLQITCNTIRDSNLNFCVFIDGLDEYEGNSVALMQACRHLMNETGIKLCVASRPEVNVPQIFEIFAEIFMQHHNKDSMYAYAREELLRASVENLDIDKRCTSRLQDELVTKAEGIILWFKLAFDELLKLCIRGSSNEIIRQYVADVPLGLDGMYKRILSLILPTYQQEAALVMFLVQQFRDFSGSSGRSIVSSTHTDLDHLWGAYDFLAEHSGELVGIERQPDLHALHKRIKDLLRGLIETYPVESDLDDIFRGASNMDTRYIHKSFYAYLERTEWVAEHIATYIPKQYPNPFLLRLFTAMINQAACDEIIDEEMLKKCMNELRHLIRIGHAWNYDRDTTSNVFSVFNSLVLGLGHLMKHRKSSVLAVVKALVPHIKDPFNPEDMGKTGRGFRLVYRPVAALNPTFMLPMDWRARHVILTTALRLLDRYARRYESAGGIAYDVIKPALQVKWFGVLLFFSFSPRGEVTYNRLLDSVEQQSLHDILGPFWSILSDSVRSFEASMAERQLDADQLSVLCDALIKHLEGHYSDFYIKSPLRYLTLLYPGLRSRHLCELLNTGRCARQVSNVARIISDLGFEVLDDKFPVHDRKCINSTTKAGLLLDWIHFDPEQYTYHDCCNNPQHGNHPYNELLLGIILRSGEYINETCYPDGTVLHALLDPQIKETRPKAIKWYAKNSLQEKFLCLVRAGIDPNIEGPKGDALEMALALLVMSKKRSSLRIDLRHEDTKLQITFIVNQLQYHRQHGEWPAETLPMHQSADVAEEPTS